jgi:hypothetical protein
VEISIIEISTTDPGFQPDLDQFSTTDQSIIPPVFAFSPYNKNTGEPTHSMVG